MGGSLTGYFGVFHRLMAAKLREIGAARDERKLAELTRSLKEDACSSQHTYVHAQQVCGTGGGRRLARAGLRMPATGG